MTTSNDKSGARGLKCARCKTPIKREDPFFPFCSERCKLIDLGAWASEKYVVKGAFIADQDITTKNKDNREQDDE